MPTYTAWFDPDTGAMISADMWRTPAPDDGLLARLREQHGVPANAVIWQTQGEAAVPNAPCADIVASVENGRVVAGSVRTRDGYQPEAPATPIPDLLTELVAKVERLPAGTIHETRLRDQKEFMKAFGIPWIKAHPEATPVDADLAILSALRAEFPNDPICIRAYEKDPLSGREDGLLMSYGGAAHQAGLTPDGSWQSLRELVVNTPEQALREALRKL